MKLRVPSFYSDFHCIASACHDTCCAGWEVDVDVDSQARYAKVSGTFGEELRSKIVDGHFVLTANERCPFLNAQNLCEIYCHLGEKALCDICREHPRFVDVFGDVVEQGVGLCGEEAVRLLLNANAPLSFIEKEIEADEEFLDAESLDARNSMFEIRTEIFTRLADRNRSLSKRLADILQFTASFSAEEKVCPAADLRSIWKHQTAVLLQGESLGAEWDFAKSQIAQAFEERGFGKRSIPWTESESEKIVAYQIFRYFAKSLYDGDMLSKVKFAVYFFLVLQNFGGELSSVQKEPSLQICAVKLLSKQLEYSDENMDALADAFFSNSYFSTGAFLRLLDENA